MYRSVFIFWTISPHFRTQAGIVMTDELFWQHPLSACWMREAGSWMLSGTRQAYPALITGALLI